jgi:ApbE superfamily uncharacterized protein (UPF0280 family)
MIREHFQYRTTITTILAERDEYVGIAKEAMIRARQEIERCIASDPFFATTLEPYSPASTSTVIRRMSEAALCADVGPMASVAGSIAWAGVEAMHGAGAVFGVIDNGGDIALISDRAVRIGLYAGASSLSGNLAFTIPQKKGVYGICTSSSSVGPSISFGVADSVTVFSSNVALADAWATSLCNRVTGPDDPAFALLEGSGVDGVFVILKEQAFWWGEIPEVSNARVDEQLITKG